MYAQNIAAATLINRVVSDYPLARERLSRYAAKRVDVVLVAGDAAVMRLALRITPVGTVEAVGEGATDVAAVVFTIPLVALLRNDQEALSPPPFTGDHELALALCVVARNVEWDIEADLARLLGDGAIADATAHRVIDLARESRARLSEVGDRVLENVADYLMHESAAFVSKDQLAQLTAENETLRAAIAQLDARIANLQLDPSTSRA